MEQLNQSHRQRERVIDYENHEYFNDTAQEKELSTQFLQMQKNQLTELQNTLSAIVLTVQSMISIWSSRICCQFLLTNDKLSQKLSKKLISLFPSSLVMCSYLILWTFLVELLVLTRSSNLTKQKKLQAFSPVSGSTIPKIWTTKNYLHTTLFYRKLRKINLLEKDYNDFENLTTNGLSSEQAVCKLRLNKIPPTGDERYAYLRSIWVSEEMNFFKDFLMWYNDKDVVPTLEAMQKMIGFYHQKEIGMSKLGGTLPSLANICLHKSTDSKIYLFTESDKVLLEKIREDMVGGLSIVFTRKAVVGENFIRKSTNLCKSIVGIDASQLYPYSMCQPMPTGLYTRWNYDSESQKFMPRQNKNAPLKKRSILISNKLVRVVGLKAMLQLIGKRRLIALVLMEFITFVTVSLKQWFVVSTTVRVKKLARHWLTTKLWEG